MPTQYASGMSGGAGCGMAALVLRSLRARLGGPSDGSNDGQPQPRAVRLRRWSKSLHRPRAYEKWLHCLTVSQSQPFFAAIPGVSSGRRRNACVSLTLANLLSSVVCQCLQTALEFSTESPCGGKITMTQHISNTVVSFAKSSAADYPNGECN